MKYVAFLDILGFKNTLKSLGQKRSIEYIEHYSSTVYRVFSNYNMHEEQHPDDKKLVDLLLVVQWFFILIMQRKRLFRTYLAV